MENLNWLLSPGALVIAEAVAIAVLVRYILVKDKVIDKLVKSLNGVSENAIKATQAMILKAENNTKEHVVLGDKLDKVIENTNIKNN